MSADRLENRQRFESKDIIDWAPGDGVNRALRQHIGKGPFQVLGTHQVESDSEDKRLESYPRSYQFVYLRGTVEGDEAIYVECPVIGQRLVSLQNLPINCNALKLIPINADYFQKVVPEE